jgi:hypothetical protein
VPSLTCAVPHLLPPRVGARRHGSVILRRFAPRALTLAAAWPARATLSGLPRVVRGCQTRRFGRPFMLSSRCALRVFVKCGAPWRVWRNPPAAPLLVCSRLVRMSDGKSGAGGKQPSIASFFGGGGAAAAPKRAVATSAAASAGAPGGSKRVAEEAATLAGEPGVHLPRARRRACGAAPRAHRFPPQFRAPRVGNARRELRSVVCACARARAAAACVPLRCDARALQRGCPSTIRSCRASRRSLRRRWWRTCAWRRDVVRETRARPPPLPRRAPRRRRLTRSLARRAPQMQPRRRRSRAAAPGASRRSPRCVVVVVLRAPRACACVVALGLGPHPRRCTR